MNYFILWDDILAAVAVVAAEAASSLLHPEYTLHKTIMIKKNCFFTNSNENAFISFFLERLDWQATQA